MGIKKIIYDKGNTLTEHYDNEMLNPRISKAF